MRPKLEDECDRNHLGLGSDFNFGKTTVRSLFSDNKFVGFDLNIKMIIIDYVSMIYLKFIPKRLLKEATIQCDKEGKKERSWCITAYEAVGRGGEIKFNDTDEWIWHPRFEVPDIGWTELKTKEKYVMQIVRPIKKRKD